MTIRVPVSLRARILYEKYEGIALHVANLVSKKYRRDSFELADESLSILARIVVEDWERFDPRRSSACTWIYWRVLFGLKTYCARRRYEELPTEGGLYRGKSRLERLFLELEEEGQALLRIICEAPGDLADSLCPTAPTRARNLLRMYLEDSGWREEKIERAWKQLEEVVLA